MSKLAYFVPHSVPVAGSAAAGAAYKLFWQWLNAARGHVDLYAHPPKPKAARALRARRQALRDGWDAYGAAASCYRYYAKIVDERAWEAADREVVAANMLDNLSTVRGRLHAEERVMGSLPDLATLPPDFVAALTVEPANTIAPLPARTRRTKKDALAMGRPLSPKLVWNEKTQNFRFRCRFKDGGRPWFELEPGLTKEAAAKAALEVAELASRGVIRAPAAVVARAKPAPRETVATWSERWIEDREIKGLASAGRDRSRLAMYVLPVIGSKPIATITRAHIEALVTDLDEKIRAGKLGWKTAQNVWGNVTKMFDDAANSKNPTLRARADNPCPKGTRGPDKGKPKKKAFLYPGEARQLLACEAVRVDFRRAAALAIYLGLRSGELRSLRWEDIDLDQRTITVALGYNREKHEDKETKSGEPRTFTIEPALLPLLRAMHKAAGGEGRVLTMRRFFKTAGDLRAHLRTAKVGRKALFASDAQRKNITFHDLRATCLTWMAARGDNSMKIQRRAGHADFDTTDGYVRTAGEIEGAFVDVFGELPASLFVGLDTSSGPNDGKKKADISGMSAQLAVSATSGREDSKIRPMPGTSTIPGDSPSQRQDIAPLDVSWEPCPSVPMSIPDPVEAALADAVRKATDAGAWDAVASLVAELRERRSARAAVVDLATARRDRAGR